MDEQTRSGEWERGTGWAAHVEPINRAILDLVCTLPARWTETEDLDLSSTEEEALRLLTRAGLVELRLPVDATMTAQHDTVSMVVVVSGEGTRDAVLHELFLRVPHWLDKDRRFRGAFEMRAGSGPVRLSDQGEIAKHAYLNPTADEPAFVCAFVRKLGPFQDRPRVKPNARVESCQVRSADSNHHAAVAVASAKATIGDIHIENIVNVDAGALADGFRAVFEILRKQRADGDLLGDGPDSAPNGRLESDPPPNALTIGEVAILSALAKHPKRRFQADQIQTSDDAPADIKAFRRTLRSLHRRGLVDYPHATKLGACITDKGLAALRDGQ